ncbi:MAG: hypothetical protein KIC94_05920 [Clostridiales bacterium]|nr:hypothetical protein [Clostridiales bacterium]
MYEKQAKENLSKAGQSYSTKEPLVNLPKVDERINTRQKLAEVAGVGEKTYAMGTKILKSDNEEVKQKVLSGEMSINAGYNTTPIQRDNRVPFWHSENLCLSRFQFKVKSVLFLD